MEKLRLISNRFSDADVTMEIVAIDKASDTINKVALSLDKASGSYQKYNEESDKSSNNGMYGMYKNLLSGLSQSIKKFDELRQQAKATNGELKRIEDLKFRLLTKANTGSLFDESKVNESSILSLSRTLTSVNKINLDLEDRIAKATKDELNNLEKAAEAEERKARAKEQEVERTTNAYMYGMGEGTYSRSFRNQNITDDGIQSREESHARLQKILDNETTLFGRLKNAVTGASTEINKNSNELNKNSDAMKNLSRTTDTVFGKLKQFAINYRIMSGFIRGIITSFYSLYKSAAEYEEAMNLYRVSLGKYAEDADKWAKRISNALYLDPKNVMQYTGAFYNLVGGLGVGSEAAYKMATNLTQLSYDMSSYLNIDVESAYNKLISAISGQSRAVVTAGVAMQQASLQELAYSMGIKKKVATMTQAEKTYLRYIQILRSTEKMQGDLGRTIVTPENAIRTIKAQFVQLARAIGQVLIPIVMKAIPYIMALTRMLQELANKLSSSLGFKLADIDYSSLGDFSDALEGIGDVADQTAGNVKSSINRSLAAFDDLNVVESKSESSGGSGIGAGDVLGDLEKYIDGYDMLAGLNEKFTKDSQKAEEQLRSLIPLFKTLASLWAISKLTKFVKGISDLVTAFKGLKIVQNVGKLFGKFGDILGGIGTKFKTAYDASKAFGNSGLVAIKDGITNVTSSFSLLTKGIGIVGGAITSFKVSSQGAYDYLVGDAEMTADKVMGLTGALTGLGIAAGVLSGPAGAFAVLAGELVGFAVAIDRAKQDMAWKSGYDTLFDGVGRSLNTLKTTMDNNFGVFQKYADENDKWASKTEEAGNKVNDAKEKVKELSQVLATQDTKASQQQIDDLKIAYDNLKNSVIDQITVEKNQALARIDQLHDLAHTSEIDYKRQKQAAIDAYDTEKMLTSEYADELRKLEIKKAQRSISDDEYNKKLQDIKDRYYGVNDALTNVGDNLQAYIDIQSSKWDLNNFDNTKKGAENIASGIQSIIDKTKEYKDAEKDRYDSLKEDILDDIGNTELKIRVLERAKEASGKLSAEQEKQYKAQKEYLETLQQNFNDNETAHKNSTSAIEGTLKSFLLSVGSQIDTSSKAFDITNRNLNDVYKTITKGLDEVKNADTDSAIEHMYENMDKSINEAGKTYSEKWTNTIGKYGETTVNGFVRNYEHSISSETTVGSLAFVTGKTVSDMLHAADKDKQYNEAANGLGKNVVKSVADGVEKNVVYVDDSINGMCTSIITSSRDMLGIHSPSAVFAEHGQYIVEGLAEGIDDNSSKAIHSITRLYKSVDKAFSDTSVKINVNTNVESSFNSILSKLQTFTNNWTNAINDLMKNMKSSLNNITLDNNGKVSYKTMPKVSVAKFEDGGYPTSGDLFFANENGKAEFITSIGNKTAVANQDQMVKALTNAIISGFAKLNANDKPNTTNVYIGNKKVYDGQAAYNNRQADRYGSNYIKI